MNLPNFIYAGTAKAGSTWLYKRLAAHEEVYIPPSKDTYYFDTEYHRGIDWYAQQFRTCPRGVSAVGEICHDYMHSPVAASRIISDLGKVRIILSLREPVDRLVSAYNHARKIGSQADLNESIDLYPELVNLSLYSLALEDWITKFGRENVLVLLFDDLVRDPQAFLNQVCDFLRISREPLDDGQLAPAQKFQEARSPLASRAAKSAAQVLRRAGYPAVVGRIKHSRVITSVLYRDPDDSSVLPSEELEALRQLFRTDVMRTSDLLGVDLAARWRYV